MSNVYGQAVTAEEILAAIYKQKQIKTPGMDYFARDVSSREPTVLIANTARDVSSRAREELNNITIEQYNNSSRNKCEDEIDAKSPLSQKQKVAEITAAREVSSRFSGIVVQHCIAKSGIKLAITLQTEDWAESGHKLLVTAELKRYKRLREIKTRLEDSSEFNHYLEETKRNIHELKNHSVCMGRIHHRGKRASWVKDALVVATVDNDIVDTVIVYIENEEYEIKLNGVLSAGQTGIYYATGQYGNIKNLSKIAPTIWELPLTKCGE